MKADIARIMKGASTGKPDETQHDEHELDKHEAFADLHDAMKSGDHAGGARALGNFMDLHMRPKGTSEKE